MKLKSLIIFIIFCLAQQVNGQSLNFGIQGGLNRANFSADSIQNDFPINLKTFGVVMEYAGEGIWGFQIEANYIEKGSTTKFTRNDTLTQQDLKLNYFEVPMFVKIKLGNEKFYSDAYSGISIGYGTKITNEVNEGGELFNETTNFEDFHFTPFEMSFLIGLDLNYVINDYIIYTDFRYTRGMTTLFETVDGFYRNKGTQIKAGIKYSF